MHSTQVIERLNDLRTVKLFYTKFIEEGDNSFKYFLKKTQIEIDRLEEILYNMECVDDQDCRL